MPRELEGIERFGVIKKERIARVKIDRVPKKTIQEFLTIKDLTPTVSDTLDSLGVPSGIPAGVLKTLIPGTKIAGHAITLRNLPDRVTVTKGYVTHDFPRMGAERECYMIAQPGDVVVIDGGGRTWLSNMGGLSATIAKTRGVAGNIIDGAARDVETIREVGYPVWCRGESCITSKFRHEAVSINEPITICGVQVRPGDLALADESGVVFVPFEMIKEALETAKKMADIDEKMRQAILAGKSPEEIMRHYRKRYEL